MPDTFDKHVETQYLNKPYFVQLKRIWRMTKKMDNKEKPKKIGFYLQQARKIPGSAQTNEKIIKDIFGKSQELSPNKFIEKIFKHAVPEGEKLYVKPETAYQTTQRLMPDEKLNKTIQVSIFGDIYDKILKKYENKENADDLFRAVNKYLSSHFDNAAGFIRWTEVSPNWIHIDAFQTDFFNNLKSMAYNEGKDNPEIKKIVEDFRKYEDEFFKTAMSYIVRTNPSVKIFTANTSELVAAVENVRGDVKLKKYYHQIPKKLGFQLISLDKLKQILRTRPGKKAEALINKFEKAINNTKSGSRSQGSKVTEENVKKMNSEITNMIAEQMDVKKHNPITPEQVDIYIRNTFPHERVRSAYHQYIEQIASMAKSQKDAKFKVEKFLDTKTKEIMETINKESKVGGQIWWSNKSMIFESTNYKNRMIVEQIKQLAGI